MPVTRRSATSTREATARVTTCTRPVAVALESVFSALYFACTGQIGTHELLPLLARAPVRGEVDRPHRRVAGVRRGVAAGRGAADLQAALLAVQLDRHPVHRGREPLVEPARWDPPHRVGVAVGERDAEVLLVLDVGGDPDLPLRARVVRDEVVVADRPVEAAAEARAQLEVLGEHAQAGTEPVQGRPA